MFYQVTESKSPERKGEGHTAEKLNLHGVEVYKQQQAMKYKEIEHLAFGFKHIVQIDHLEGLINLKKLQLDNNCLTKIENLGHLVCNVQPLPADVHHGNVCIRLTCTEHLSWCYRQILSGLTSPSTVSASWRGWKS